MEQALSFVVFGAQNVSIHCSSADSRHKTKNINLQYYCGMRLPSSSFTTCLCAGFGQKSTVLINCVQYIHQYCIHIYILYVVYMVGECLMFALLFIKASHCWGSMLDGFSWFGANMCDTDWYCWDPCVVYTARDQRPKEFSHSKYIIFCILQNTVYHVHHSIKKRSSVFLSFGRMMLDQLNWHHKQTQEPPFWRAWPLRCARRVLYCVVLYSISALVVA